VLKSKIEGLPNDHRLKPSCLSELSMLFALIGNHTERKRLLTCALTLAKEQRDNHQVAWTLRRLSDANRWLGLHEEGIQQAKEALGIYEQLRNRAGQAYCSDNLAQLFLADDQLDSAEEAASRTIDLISEQDDEYLACQSHRILGIICGSKGKKEKAIQNLNTALEIALRCDWKDQLHYIHYHLADLLLHEREFDDAHTHIEQAKSHAAENRYKLVQAMEIRTRILYQQGMLGETTSEVLSALEIFEELGVVEGAETCRDLLRRTEESMESQFSSLQW
jgi:tetratricopeptide (TPR) repeat protein